MIACRPRGGSTVGKPDATIVASGFFYRPTRELVGSPPADQQATFQPDTQSGVIIAQEARIVAIIRQARLAPDRRCNRRDRVRLAAAQHLFECLQFIFTVQA